MIIRENGIEIDYKDKEDLIYQSSKIMDNHCHRVGKMMQKFYFFNSIEYIENEVYSIGALHDIGKFTTPKHILNSEKPLSHDDMKIMKDHAIHGFNILLKAGFLSNSPEALATLYHHERYDGKGYPEGLAGNDIPEIARILSICDSVDAMMTKRTYKPEISDDTIKSILFSEMGKQFDPILVKKFLKYYDNIVLPIRREGNKNNIKRNYCIDI